MRAEPAAVAAPATILEARDPVNFNGCKKFDGIHFKILKHHHLLWLKLMNRDRGAILIVRDTKFKGVWGLGEG